MKERPKFYIKVQRTKEAVIEVHAEDSKTALSAVRKLAAFCPEEVPWNNATTSIRCEVLNDGQDDV